jgi:hypothetical protein
LFVCTWLRATGVEAGVQKLLGHQQLNSTMVYARVYDRTVEDDYYTAMAVVEQRLDFGNSTIDTAKPIADFQELLERLEVPHLALKTRLTLVTQLREMLREMACA